MRGNDTIKKTVLALIAGQSGIWPSGKATFIIQNKKIHVRYCSPPTYKFNINPNTLRADYEVWICGREDCYYLIPIEVIRKIYNDPQVYVDNLHPEIRIVSVKERSNEAMFASGGKTVNLTPYRGACLG